jgi:hypothetical protein
MAVSHTPGPWTDEPNEGAFKSYGFACTITRHPRLKHLCGYVDVPEGHPWWGKDWSAIAAKVHGGLTFSEGAGPGKPWRVGFDCAHSGDFSPGLERYGRRPLPSETYRDWTYVEIQTRLLARQAREAA